MIPKRLAIIFVHYFRDLFSLENDKADPLETIENIKKGVDFKGTNLWILIFAIFIASIGLNVNSTAVIIGAMLISPLMGPILGVGLGIAVNDLELVKKAFKSLGVAAVFSVATSSLYFLVSPLDTAQSELLARTNPTIWDVLIALFGGLSGIVAVSRKEKTNVIPGVAIATALMPPLCTAGFGIATGNLYYFLGAFYLFFINSVFITLSTFLIVRYLKFPEKQFINPLQGQIVKRWIFAIVVITVIPSTYLAYLTVKRSVFENNAHKFIDHELQFENTTIISQALKFDTKQSKIEITLFGKPIAERDISRAKKNLPEYNLNDVNLVIHQGDNLQAAESKLDNEYTKEIISEIYQKNDELLKTKDARIDFLEDALVRAKTSANLTGEISPELKALFPTVKSFSIYNGFLMNMDSLRQDTICFAYVKFSRQPKRSDVKKLQEWLSVRTKKNNIRIVAD